MASIFIIGVFQLWFIGTPVVWFALVKLFRALDWWKFPTRKGARTSDIMAFEIVAGISVTYLGVAGLILHYGWFGTEADSALLHGDMMYGKSQWFIDHLIYPMVTFQLWNVVLCLFTPDLNVIEMLAHHLITASLGYFGLCKSGYLHGNGVFFFGIAELTNIPLTMYDCFKYMKPAKWAEKYSFMHNLSQYGFAASFVVLRLIVWPRYSWAFWKESLALLQNGKGHSNFVIGTFLFANVFLTFLQFFWGYKIVQSALGGGGSDKKKSKSGKEAEDEDDTPKRVTRSTTKKSARR